MEAIFLLVAIIEWGICLLIIISVFIYCVYNSFKENSLSHFFAGILWILIFGSVPAWGLYITTKKYGSKPEPTKTFQTCIDGELRLLYQDTIHLCNPTDKQSTCFTALMSNVEISQKDTCIICLRPFLAHNTQAEHRYYEAMSYMSESMIYCCNSNSVNSIESDNKCSHGINPFKIYVDNITKGRMHSKKTFLYFCTSESFSIYANKNKLP